MSTGPSHYTEAERLADEAAAWMDADWGWKGSLSSEERIAYRMADLAAAQVYATLALADATAMTAGEEGMNELDFEAWDRVAGVQDDEHDEHVVAAPSPLASTPLAAAFGAAPAEYREPVDAEHYVAYITEGPGNFAATLTRYDGADVEQSESDEDALIRILDEGVGDGPVFVSVLSSTDGGPDFADYTEAKDTNLVDRLLAWKNDAIERELALNAAYVDPFATDDIQRPCTRCGDLNHASRDCEAEDPYDGMANADVMSASELYESDRDAEFAQDAADEARWAAEAEGDAL